MILTPLPIPGAFAVDSAAHRDARGSFRRTFSAALFAAAGLDARVAETSLAENPVRGTLRGLHYAARPSTEAKLVRCVSGRAFDVLVDVRPRSPTYLGWTSLELSATSGQSVFIPPGVAHGYLTLEEGTSLIYQMTEAYDPGASRGLRFDDPALGIVWPFPPTVICDRDRTYPDTVVGAASLTPRARPGRPRRPSTRRFA